jgi:glycosyltransferase involved in cell wall biosynthesis
MLPYVKRTDLSVLIVGDGDGRRRIENAVPPAWSKRVVFTGRVPESEVVDTLNAMDIGFITQTMDELGSFRLTTKLPEYLAAGLPVAMSPIPGYFDFARNAGWPLPAKHPSGDDFHRACALWIDTVTRHEVVNRRAIAPEIARRIFDYDVLGQRFNAFIDSIMNQNQVADKSTNQISRAAPA